MPLCVCVYCGVSLLEAASATAATKTAWLPQIRLQPRVLPINGAIVATPKLSSPTPRWGSRPHSSHFCPRPQRQAQRQSQDVRCLASRPPWTLGDQSWAEPGRRRGLGWSQGRHPSHWYRTGTWPGRAGGVASGDPPNLEDFSCFPTSRLGRPGVPPILAPSPIVKQTDLLAPLNRHHFLGGHAQLPGTARPCGEAGGKGCVLWACTSPLRLPTPTPSASILF